LFRQKGVSLLGGKEGPSQQLLKISGSQTASFCRANGGQELSQLLIWTTCFCNNIAMGWSAVTKVWPIHFGAGWEDLS